MSPRDPCAGISQREAVVKAGSGEPDFIHRAKVAIDRTVLCNDGIPAEIIIAKLETKLAVARKIPPREKPLY